MDYTFFFASYLMAAFIFAFIYKKDKQILRIQKKEAIKVIGVAAFIFVLRCVLASHAPADIDNELIWILKNMPIWPLFFVFWEDLVFTAPILYLERKGYNKTKIALTIVAVLIFGSLHLYQGWFGFVFSSVYLYFISIGAGRKYGLGTIMIFHVLFDLSALMAVRLFL